MTTIGKPVYGNGENRRANAANANWRLDKEGSHIYRILPPFGLLAKLGRWSQYEAIHWGAELSGGKKRAFRCIQRKNRKTKMVELECPMCMKYNEQFALMKNKEKEMTDLKKTREEIELYLKPITDWLQLFNLQKGHYLNVLRQDGQIGRLFIKIKCKQALDIKIPKWIEKTGVDPIAVDGGLWIDFQRTGMGRNDTVYDVSLVEETVEINGRKLTDVKRAPLSGEVVTRMEKEAFELADYYKDLTYDEIKMMVSSNFDPAIVDSVFGAPVVSVSPEVDGDDEPAENEPLPTLPTPVTPVVSATPPPPPAQAVQAVQEVSSEEALILAQLAAVRAKKNPQSQPTVSKPGEMSTEDFIKAFNGGKLA
jgi:hypothetical protein